MTKFSLLAVLLLLITTSTPAIAKKKKPTVPSTENVSILSKFKTCKEANRAGVRNVPVTPGYIPPGWGHSADRDNDGIACEKK